MVGEKSEGDEVIIVFGFRPLFFGAEVPSDFTKFNTLLFNVLRAAWIESISEQIISMADMLSTIE